MRVKRWIYRIILGKQKQSMSLQDEEHVSDKTMFEQHNAANKVNVEVPNQTLYAKDTVSADQPEDQVNMEVANETEYQQDTTAIQPKATVIANNRSLDVYSDDNDKSEPTSQIVPAPSTEDVLNAFHGFLFPQIAPIRMSTFIILTALTAIPTAGYIIAFTKMGFGKQTFYFLANNFSNLIYPIGGGLTGFAFLLYLFDVHHWSSECGVTLRNICYTILASGMFLVVLFLAGDYPYAPIVLFILLMPFYLAGIRFVFYRHKSTRMFIHWSSGPLFSLSVITTIVWVTWTLVDEKNEWNLGIALSEAAESGCVANFEDYPNCESYYYEGQACFHFDEDLNTLNFNDCEDGEVCRMVYADCYNTFILWVGPFLASLGTLFLSFFASFMRDDGTPDQEASKFVRVWMFLLFAMWVTASLAGAGAGVFTTLASLVLACFAAAAIFIFKAFNMEERKEKTQRVMEKLSEKYGAWSDVFRGLLIVTCTPVFLLYLVVSFLVQRVRVMTFKCYTKPPNTTESLRNITGEYWLTIEGRRIIRVFQSWDTTKVFTYAVYWGLAFMIMNVIVSQYTLVFLSWLIEWTSGLNLGVVTIILVGVGMTMFLLPPVPGVPIYLTLGIVIIPVGREIMGIFWSICYAMGVSLALKLLACTLQQKMIGGLLSNSVGVRQFVGVNSNIIRAMKLVLREPGLGIPKVSILIGGPDWPTSVLCGIMGLRLLPVLVGTLPIVFLILPTLLTGSFTYMADVRDELTGEHEFPWAGTMATVFAALTGLVQFGSMVVAAFYLERVIDEKKDELDLIPIDEEVKLADERDEALRQAYSELSQWEILPSWARFLLCVSLSCMIVTCYMVQLFASYCFRDFQLTDSIETALDGDWKNLTKPLGIAANILLLTSVVLLQIFVSWVNHIARKKCSAQGAIAPEGGETTYDSHRNVGDEDS
mmetsp:Transcript_27340/g.41158  ORF Transcript_27340/g.41158 Transcript_27340/m.41158 type:complete len:932 (+) Transcript_27340:150-2945(+)